ncbi:MAG: hypothetical protein HY941_10080 [Gammaproteobacteria bacterium]|nr:hypothetical protein [Gammaproteobacteria bacterium]
MDNNTGKSRQASRRDFIKKLAYMPPAIATLTVLPAFHASGSGLTGTTGGNTWGSHHLRFRRR